MKRILVALLLLIPCVGCTTIALEHYTLAQIRSSGSVRDTETLAALAAVADDPDALPSYSVVSDGTTKVQDSFTLNPITTWTRALRGFSTEVVNANDSRSPTGTWTLVPIAEYERLVAMRCACRVVLGLSAGCNDDCAILDDPQEHYDGKPHFGVRKRLAHIRPGAIRHGTLADVPHGARHKAHCRGTWVWVMPEDSEAFAQFTLSLLDIASLEYAAIYAPRLIAYVFREQGTNIADVNDPKNKVDVLSTTEVRAVKREHKAEIEQAIEKGIASGKVELSYAQWIDFTVPFHGVRSTTPQASSVAFPGTVTQPFLLSPGSPVQPGTPRLTEPKTFSIR